MSLKYTPKCMSHPFTKCCPPSGNHSLGNAFNTSFKAHIRLGIIYRISTLHWKHWKPGILSYTFPALENSRNLLKKWGKARILTQNLEKTWNWSIMCFKIHFSRYNLHQKSFTSMSYLHYQYNHCDSKPNWHVISLLLPRSNLENTWNFM